MKVTEGGPEPFPAGCLSFSCFYLEERAAAVLRVFTQTLTHSKRLNRNHTLGWKNSLMAAQV